MDGGLWIDDRYPGRYRLRDRNGWTWCHHHRWKVLRLDGHRQQHAVRNQSQRICFQDHSVTVEFGVSMQTWAKLVFVGVVCAGAGSCDSAPEFTYQVDLIDETGRAVVMVDGVGVAPINTASRRFPVFGG